MAEWGNFFWLSFVKKLFFDQMIYHLTMPWMSGRGVIKKSFFWSDDLLSYNTTEEWEGWHYWFARLYSDFIFCFCKSFAMEAWRRVHGDWRRWKHGIGVWGWEWFSCGSLFSRILKFCVDQFSITIQNSNSVDCWRWGLENGDGSMGIGAWGRQSGAVILVVFCLLSFVKNEFKA